jgi:serine protease
MMRTRVFAVALLLLPSAAPAPLAAREADVVMAARTPRRSAPAAGWREGQAIVAFREGATEDAVERVLDAGRAREWRRSRSGARRLVALDPGTTVAEAVERFSRMPEVDYAEPNGVVRLSDGRTFTPNDTHYRVQWNLTQLNAERTWAIQKGKPEVAVAVLDTGVAYEDYEDPRTGQVFRKAPDWGTTRFLPGWDFVNDDAHPNDDNYHGTHVASTIAEATNNGLGMAGLAFGCAVMPVKVLDANGDGTYFDVAEGIELAVDYAENGQHPVKVVNLSLGGDGTSQAIRNAINRATSAGVLVVAAAGNSGRNEVEFPASFAPVVAVGATDARRQRASYSNTGADLDLVAPGGDCDRDDDADGIPDCIFQQRLDPAYVDLGRYDHFCYCGVDGTSMATPHVAAAAALLYSQGFTDPAAVRAALEQTAERLGGAPPGGRNDTCGNGLIQPAAALAGMGLDGPR